MKQVQLLLKSSTDMNNFIACARADLPRLRCAFFIERFDERWVWLVDQLPQAGNGAFLKSVTNDAEAVVRNVAHHYPGRRIAYLDTEKRWTELIVRNGEFAGFGMAMQPLR